LGILLLYSEEPKELQGRRLNFIKQKVVSKFALIFPGIPGGFPLKPPLSWT